MAELAGPMGDYYRPNFFVNTPDINPVYLQTGGRAGHLVRATLAATLSGNWGVYSGFELCEARAAAGQARNTSIPRNTRSRSGTTIGRQHQGRHPQPQQDPPRERGPARFPQYAAPESPSSTTTTSSAIRQAQSRQDELHPGASSTSIRAIARIAAYEMPLWEWGLGDNGSIDVEDLPRRPSLHPLRETHQIALDPLRARRRDLAPCAAGGLERRPMIDRTETQWYRDAIIYQLHVKSFFDANNDGIGDFTVGYGKARLRQGSRSDRDLGDAVLSLAAARRRLRHLRLSRHQSVLRRAEGFQGFRQGGARSRHPRHHRTRHQPHVRPASLVPTRPRRQARIGGARLLRLVRHREEVRGHTHHLPRHGKVQLDLGRGRASLLLAPLLFAPAGPQLRQSEGASMPCSTSCATGSTSASTACASTPFPIWSSAKARIARTFRDPRGAEDDPRRRRQGLSRPHAACRSQPMARGNRAIFRRRRRMPHGVPLPADAAHLHGAGAGRPAPDHRHHAPDAGDPGGLPMVDLPAQP